MKVTQKTIELLTERKIFTLPYNAQSRFRVGDDLIVGRRARIEAYTGFLDGPLLYTMGTQSYTWSSLKPDTILGRYCSIASRVRSMGDPHPYQRFTSSSITYNQRSVWVTERIKEAPDFSFHEKEVPAPPPTVIGNDVWIGANATIKNGIIIGDGAVIGTGAIVTKDVMPYTVVGGVPARVLKYRFSERIVEELLDLRWWDYSFTDFKNMDSDIEVEEFIYHLKNEIAAGRIQKYNPQVTTGDEIIDTMAAG